MNSPAVQPGQIEFAGCRRENLELLPLLSERIAGVLATGRVLQGPEVEAFEDELRLACCRAHAVCVGSGTDALYFALLGLGVRPGDEVLVPDLSFIATAAAVARAGARPVFVDVDRACQLDLVRAERLITPRTRALVYVQIFGGMGDPDELERFAAAHRLHVLEDAAQAFGARYGGRAAGSVGRVSALSFDPMKVLSAPGSGGAVLTDDAELAARVRRLRYHGREQGEYVEIGLNSQMPGTTAAVLSAKLPYQETWRERREQIAAAFHEAFRDLPVSFPVWSTAVQHVRHKFVLRCAHRDALRAHLDACEVPTLVHYARPFHRESGLFEPGDDSEFPNACMHARESLSLPMHAHLTDVEVEQITDAVQAFFRDGCAPLTRPAR